MTPVQMILKSKGEIERWIAV